MNRLAWTFHERVGPAVIAAHAPGNLADPDSIGALVARRIAEDGTAVRVIAPGRLPLPRRDHDWVTIPLQGRSPRLESVRLPRALVRANPLVAVAQVHARDAEMPDLILRLWARFAHPLERIGAAVGRGDDSIAADIALAITPNLVVVADGHAVYATADPIAADLALLSGCAWRVRATGKDTVGPWENALIQRATELGLGALLPTDLEVVAASGDPTDEEQAAVLRLEMMLGVPG